MRNKLISGAISRKEIWGGIDKMLLNQGVSTRERESFPCCLNRVLCRNDPRWFVQVERRKGIPFNWLIEGSKDQPERDISEDEGEERVRECVRRREGEGEV